MIGLNYKYEIFNIMLLNNTFITTLMKFVILWNFHFLSFVSLNSFLLLKIDKKTRRSNRIQNNQKSIRNKKEQRKSICWKLFIQSLEMSASAMTINTMVLTSMVASSWTVIGNRTGSCENFSIIIIILHHRSQFEIDIESVVRKI